MRIGLFTESYDVINGVSTSVKTLAAELAAAGHEPVIVAPRYPGAVDDPEADGGILVLRLPSWRTLFNPTNPFAYPPIGNLVPRALRGIAPFDIVHTQQPFGMGLHGRVTARRLGVPLVSTNHTLYSEYTHYFPVVPTATARAWVATSMRRYYNSCDAVIVPSKATARILEGLGIGPAERLRVVPTGVPEAPSVLPAALEQTRRAYDLPDGVPVLLFVGRIAREKNLDLLLGAYAALPEPRPILLLVGSGPYVDACRKRVAELGIEPTVRFAGFLKRTQLAPIYATATLFVFPSATETQGVVLSEAQSHGLPCVVVNGGGAPEFVRDGVDALVVPPGDPAAFVAAIQTLLADDEKRRAMSAAALSSPLHPTPAEMARQMVAVYESARSRPSLTPLTPVRRERSRR